MTDYKTPKSIAVEYGNKKQLPTFKAIARIKNSIKHICPITKGTPMSLTKEGFIRACTKFRKKAIKGEENGTSSTSTTTGWESLHTNTCLECKVGQAVSAGKPFKQPKLVTWIELDPAQLPKVPKVKVNKKGEGAPPTPRVPKIKSTVRFCKKLTAEDVRVIKDMDRNGYNQREIRDVFPFVGRTTIYDILKGRSWKHIK